MPYVISKTEHPRVWCVRYEGAVDLTVRMEALRECLKIARNQEMLGVLVEFRHAHLDMSSLDHFSMGVEESNKDELRAVKAAFLHKDESADDDFTALVAKNRGMMIEVFRDADQAMAWLLA